MTLQRSEADPLTGITHFLVRADGADRARDAGIDVPALITLVERALRDGGVNVISEGGNKRGAAILAIEFHTSHAVIAGVHTAIATLVVFDLVRSERRKDLTMFARVWTSAPAVVPASPEATTELADEVIRELASDFLRAYKSVNR